MPRQWGSISEAVSSVHSSLKVFLNSSGLLRTPVTVYLPLGIGPEGLTLAHLLAENGCWGFCHFVYIPGCRKVVREEGTPPDGQRVPMNHWGLFCRELVSFPHWFFTRSCMYMAVNSWTFVLCFPIQHHALHSAAQLSTLSPWECPNLALRIFSR